jgi:hypothetical protein
VLRLNALPQNVITDQFLNTLEIALNAKNTSDQFLLTESNVVLPAKHAHHHTEKSD